MMYNERYGSITLLAVVSILLGLLHVSKKKDEEHASIDSHYNIPAMVLMAELIKLVLSIFVSCVKALSGASETGGDERPDKGSSSRSTGPGTGILTAISGVASELFGWDAWKLAVPACIYVVQNNLRQVAAKDLALPMYESLSNLKILTTAFFAVIVVHKRLHFKRWIALLLLASGVGMVQDSISYETSSTAFHQASEAIGLLTLGIACVLSGLSAVLFEAALKAGNIDIWIVNARLAFFSIFAATIPFLRFRQSSETTFGTLINFSQWEWAVIMCQVINGFAIASVVKHTDSIVKGYVQSFAIVGSLIATGVTPPFLCGALLVATSAALYNTEQISHLRLAGPDAILMHSAYPYADGDIESLPSTPDSSSSLYRTSFDFTGSAPASPNLSNSPKSRPRSALEALLSSPTSTLVEEPEETYFLLSEGQSRPVKRSAGGEPMTPTVEAFSFEHHQELFNLGRDDLELDRKMYS